MPENQHTPGPWKTRKAQRPLDQDTALDFAIVAEGPIIIAEAYGRVGADHYVDAETNARLIAAAPRMFKALTNLLMVAPMGQPEYREAQAAIAEAEGSDEH